MSNSPLKDYVDAINGARSLEDAAKAIAGIGRELGMDCPGFVENFSSNGKHSYYFEGIFATKSPLGKEPTQRVCATSMQRICPVFRACYVSVDPFVWSVSKMLNTEGPGSGMLRVMWESAAKRGVVGGLTIPIHLPKARLGAVGWLAMSPEVDLKAILATHSHELRLAAQLFMGLAYRERPVQSHRVDTAALTERELECLTWVALGKTDAEIGELIGRSPSTARFHVDSAAEKLGVNNRARAAAVACQMGLVHALA
jgi:DNA-binding CsgD family transcriptional regulator